MAASGLSPIRPPSWARAVAWKRSRTNSPLLAAARRPCRGGRRGDVIQAEVGAQVAEVLEQLDEAAVVGLEEGLQGQQGEALVLGEVLPRELGRISRPSLLGEAQSLAGHRSRRWGQGSCGSHGTSLDAATPRRDSTTQRSRSTATLIPRSSTGANRSFHCGWPRTWRRRGQCAFPVSGRRMAWAKIRPLPGAPARRSKVVVDDHDPKPGPFFAGFRPGKITVRLLDVAIRREDHVRLLL